MDQTPPVPENHTEKQTVQRDASWGATISIVIILVMIIVGALYAWGQRLAEMQAVKEAQQSVSF